MSVPRPKATSGPVVIVDGVGYVNGWINPPTGDTEATPAVMDLVFYSDGGGLHQYALSVNGEAPVSFYFNLPFMPDAVGNGVGFEVLGNDASEAGTAFFNWVQGLAIGVTAADYGGGAGNLTTNSVGESATLQITGDVGSGMLGISPGNPVAGQPFVPGEPASGDTPEYVLIAAVAGKIFKPLSLTYGTPDVPLAAGVQVAAKKDGVYTNIWTQAGAQSAFQFGQPNLDAVPEIEGAAIVLRITEASPELGTFNASIVCQEITA
jgi:hypothetical protein